MAKVGLYAIDTSTTLESNKSQAANPHTRYRSRPHIGHGHGVHASFSWSSRELRCLGAHCDISVPSQKGQRIRHCCM